VNHAPSCQQLCCEVVIWAYMGMYGWISLTMWSVVHCEPHSTLLVTSTTEFVQFCLVNVCLFLPHQASISVRRHQTPKKYVRRRQTIVVLSQQAATIFSPFPLHSTSTSTHKEEWSPSRAVCAALRSATRRGAFASRASVRPRTARTAPRNAPSAATSCVSRTLPSDAPTKTATWSCAQRVTTPASAPPATTRPVLTA
jgi:hypothetical protein